MWNAVGNNHDFHLFTALEAETEPENHFFCSLIRKTLNLNLCCRGESALHIAARKNFLNSARILLEAGASVDVRGSDYNTPLHFSSGVKDGTEMIRLLLRYGADVNAVALARRTPLLEAARNQCVKNFKVLLENGAKVNVQTPLLSILAHGFSPVAIFFRKGFDVKFGLRGAIRPLDDVAKRDKLQIVQLFLENKAEVNVCDEKGRTPLHWVAMNRTQPVEIMKELIKSGAMLNVLDKSGLSPLGSALFWFNLEATRELLLCGAPFELLESLKRLENKFCSAEDRNDVTAISQLLIQHMFINNPDDSLENIRQQLMQDSVIQYLGNWSNSDCNLMNIKDACLSEVDTLSKMSCGCGNSSIWGSMMGAEACICDTQQAILKFLVSGQSTNFRDAFFRKLSKEFLLEAILNQISFFEFKKSEKRTMLNWPCMKEIERYVSFEDLVKFLQHKDSVMDASEFEEFLAFVKGESTDKSSNETNRPNPKRLRVL